MQTYHKVHNNATSIFSMFDCRFVRPYSLEEMMEADDEPH
jgi:hypothetical protein